MNLNYLLRERNIDPQQVLVLRHRARERELNRVLPWLAEEKPEIYNAYQKAQRPKVEKAMSRAGYLASFVGHQPGKALFVGIYKIGASRRLTLGQYWNIPANKELESLGMKGFTQDQGRSTTLWFDLKLTEHYAD